jgi:hypothetical protein
MMRTYVQPGFYTNLADVKRYQYSLETEIKDFPHFQTFDAVEKAVLMYMLLPPGGSRGRDL